LRGFSNYPLIPGIQPAIHLGKLYLSSWWGEGAALFGTKAMHLISQTASKFLWT